MEKILILRISVLEDFTCTLETTKEIFFEVTDLVLLHAENLLIDVGHILVSHGLEIFICDRSEKRLDITDRKNILKIIDKDQHQ